MLTRQLELLSTQLISLILYLSTFLSEQRLQQTDNADVSTISLKLVLIPLDDAVDIETQPSGSAPAVFTG